MHIVSRLQGARVLQQRLLQQQQRRLAGSSRPTPRVAPPVSKLRSFPSSVKIILGSSAIAATAAYTLWPGAAAEEPGSGSAELPLEYDAAAIGSYWSKRPLQVVGRICK